MNRLELKIKLSELDSQYQKDKNSIYKDYALSNNKYKVGDIVTDHMGSLLIEKISIYISFGDPQCIYEGKRLTKTGAPSKKESSPVYSNNILTL